jgi:hypothetical protein
LKGWHRNRSGNWQIELRGFRVTVFQKPMGWGAVISHPSKPEGAFTRETYRSFAEAQLASFDVFTQLEAQITDR